MLASPAAVNLEAFLEPQERFDDLAAMTRGRFGREVIDLSYPNAYDGPDEAVRRALQLAVDDESELAFQYTPHGGRTTVRRAVASRLSLEYDVPFAYRDVILTPGATAALNIVFRALFGPADEVVVLTPCWFDYPLYLANLGIPFRFVTCRDDKHLDLPAIARALGARTRGIVLSQPCCPTGVLYSKEEIAELAALLTRAEKNLNVTIYLVADEVHRHLMWSFKTFHSPLATYPRSVTIYSFGKALALQGQRIGYVAVSPHMPEREEVRHELARVTRMMGFCAPTTLMQRAVCQLLDHRPALDLLAVRQKTIRSKLKGWGYEVCDGDATVFVYVKAPIADDFRFAELLAAQGVLVVPSTLFHEPGHFRISVTSKWESILEGLPAFERVRFLI